MFRRSRLRRSRFLFVLYMYTLYTRQRLLVDFEDNLFELSKVIESILGEAPNGVVCVLKNGYVEHKTLANDDSGVRGGVRILIRESNPKWAIWRKTLRIVI